MREVLTAFITALEFGFLGYFLVINTLYLAFSIFAYVALVNHRRRWTARELGAIMRSPATPGVSVLVPAFNEETGIVETVRSLLMLNYPQFEVIVISDGSTDRTIGVLQDAFGLIRAPGSSERRLPTAEIRGIYRSVTIREVVVIDKANGGKADALNAGINAARFPLVCCIDADSIVEEHALTRAVLPFIEDPRTVAAGGIVRIGNGCRVAAGRVTEVRAPGSWLATFQVVEYLRAFLAARVTHSAFNALLIVSGAFGVFRRDILIEAGGLNPDTIGEDMELVVRLHRHCLEKNRPYRIVFQPDPVVWTEAPETVGLLAQQRNRWQRGTLQVLDLHRSMIGKPRFGRIGLVAMPYYLCFEALGPLIELVALVLTLSALALGLVDGKIAQLVFMAAVLYGTMISVASVLLEELSFRRYLRLRDVFKLLAAAVFEHFGYRQLTSWWRLRGTIDYYRRLTGWGTMTRKGLAST